MIREAATDFASELGRTFFTNEEIWALSRIFSFSSSAIMASLS